MMGVKKEVKYDFKYGLDLFVRSGGSVQDLPSFSLQLQTSFERQIEVSINFLLIFYYILVSISTVHNRVRAIRILLCFRYIEIKNIIEFFLKNHIVYKVRHHQLYRSLSLRNPQKIILPLATNQQCMKPIKTIKSGGLVFSGNFREFFLL